MRDQRHEDKRVRFKVTEQYDICGHAMSLQARPLRTPDLQTCGQNRSAAARLRSSESKATTYDGHVQRDQRDDRFVYEHEHWPAHRFFEIDSKRSSLSHPLEGSLVPIVARDETRVMRLHLSIAQARMST